VTDILAVEPITGIDDSIHEYLRLMDI
jgi:hypothetical protein